MDASIIVCTQTGTITISVFPYTTLFRSDAVADQTVSATTTDNDAPGFTISQSGGSTAVSETGTTDTFTVVLNSQPSSNVVLTVAKNDATETSLSASNLTFTTANWNTVQT